MFPLIVLTNNNTLLVLKTLSVCLKSSYDTSNSRSSRDSLEYTGTYITMCRVTKLHEDYSIVGTNLKIVVNRLLPQCITKRIKLSYATLKGEQIAQSDVNVFIGECIRAKNMRCPLLFLVV